MNTISSFDPSGQIFASIIPSLDVHKLSINSINQSTPLVQHTFDRGVSVQCLKWALVSGTNHPKKKRKRDSVSTKSTSLEDLIVILGTNKGSLLIFSPSKGAVTSALLDGHSLPISTISVNSANNTFWSTDSNGNICEWNVSKRSLLRSIKTLPDLVDINLISPILHVENQFLLTSSNVHLVDLKSNPSTKLLKSSILKTYPGFIHPINDVIFSTQKNSLFLCSSTNDRNINLYSVNQPKLLKIFISQSNVETILFNEDDSVLGAVTDEGLVELFVNPLDEGGAVSSTAAISSTSTPSKRKTKSTPSLKSTLQIKISRPSKEIVKINKIFFHEDFVTISWLENASIPVFEQIRWKDETSNQPLSGVIELTKSINVPGGEEQKSAVTLDPAASVTYNEANAIVSSGRDVQNLESDDDEDEESTLADRLEALNTSSTSKVNGSIKATSKTTKTTNISTAATTTNTHTDGTNATSTADATTTTAGAAATRPSRVRKLDVSTPGSFAVILNQALKTNDRVLLESCLITRDENMIKVSVQRLESYLAVRFLERLAEKLARAPTRVGQLNVWIKWVMISHGGYLVTLPNLLKTLSSLHSTVAERIASLPRLLALQGRLELLYSQMEIRRDLLAETRKAEQDSNDVEDEAEVEYIEDGPEEEQYIINGEEDLEDDSDSESEVDSDDDEANISAFTNGKLQDDYEEEDDEDEGYSDLEAQETFLDEEEEMDISDDDLEEAVVVSKTPKKQNGRV